jgi:ParB family chromosome partitioning protein
MLVLKDALFNKRDAQLVPTAGSCADCPKRTGHNKLLFGDDLGKQGDRCTDPSCYQAKVSAHVAKTIAAQSELVQISTAYGAQKEGSPVVPRSKYTAIGDEKPRSKDEAKRAGIQSVQVHHVSQHPNHASSLNRGEDQWPERRPA